MLMVTLLFHIRKFKAYLLRRPAGTRGPELCWCRLLEEWGDADIPAHIHPPPY